MQLFWGAHVIIGTFGGWNTELFYVRACEQKPKNGCKDFCHRAKKNPAAEPREGSGARGSRTLVQTGKPYAFYTLSHR